MAEPAPTTDMQAAIKKVSVGARVFDAFLCVVFAYWALTSDSTLWTVIWAAGSAFCAYTAVTGPLDRLPALIQRALGVRKG